MPCTGHSSHGKASNKIKIAEEHTQANTALFGVVNYIVNSNPSIMISENVIQARNSATYILLKAEINRLGYDVFEYILDNKQAGSIEKRKRYWFVAVSKGLSKKVNLNNLIIPTYKKQNKTIKSILNERSEEKWMKSNYFNARLEKNVLNNRGYKTSFVDENQDSVNVIPRNYTKRQISNPHFINKEGDKIRLFNPEEHCLIKGVPFKLLEGVSDTKAHETLGQSVLYKQAMGIGELIGEFCSKIKGH
jgi:DNA (cytosine-5)-methyltransferase 1